MSHTETNNMRLPVEFKVSGCSSWHGKVDKSGNPIDEVTYTVKAFVFGNLIASVGFAQDYKSEAIAIRACKEYIKEL
jgi:hypothetical protein